MKILLLDNYDSFTYNLRDYLLQLGADCMVLRNDERSEQEIEQLDFEAIMFSPGPKRPADAGLMPRLIEKYHQQLPLLGICLGHQAIGEFFGAHLVKAAEPMHGKTSLVQHTDHVLFAGIPREFTAMRYHSLLLENLDNTPLQCLARTKAGEIMALAHRSLPVFGVQFHPESILTEFGKELLKNWLHQAVNSRSANQAMSAMPVSKAASSTSKVSV